MEKLLKKFDAVYCQTPANLFYLSGYKNDDAKIVLFKDTKYYFTDARYFEEVNSLPFIIKNIVEFGTFLRENNIQKIAADCSITIDEYKKLKEFGVKKVKDASPSFYKSRAVKTEQEIAYIKKAQEITDKTFSEILNYITEGMTEKELDRILKSLLYRFGADGLSFEPIVAFGKNTSKPHAHPGDTVLQKGDFVTLDFGASYNNYCSDMTRTVAFSTPTDEMAQIYSYVYEAQKRALENLHAGMTGVEAHMLAADYFNQQGVGKFFIHSLGHGLGIEIHEKPYLSPKYTDKLPCGCVTSVEPGLYLEGKFGVRIEDIVVFTKKRVINLTNIEKKLIII